MGRYTFPNWRVARIPRIESVLNFYVSVILNCYCSNEMFEFCHIFKGFIRYLGKLKQHLDKLQYYVDWNQPTIINLFKTHVYGRQQTGSDNFNILRASQKGVRK
jgi:hypothetical protein